jgi:hypothetical protein
MVVADKFSVTGVFPIGRRHCVVCKVVMAQPKTAVSECAVGLSIGRVESIVLRSVECVDDEKLQRSSAQGYIIVREIVTAGVCDDGCGRWCGCFVRRVQGVFVYGRHRPALMISLAAARARFCQLSNRLRGSNYRRARSAGRVYTGASTAQSVHLMLELQWTRDQR